MTYFKDLTKYSYNHDKEIDNTINIGWLNEDHFFDTEEPSDEVLANLWDFCKISVIQTRGLHECEFCTSGDFAQEEREGLKLALGSSEIRVFTSYGTSFAAPTLIYHYVKKHHYKLPVEFVTALINGPKPPDTVYFKLLKEEGLNWTNTHFFEEHAETYSVKGIFKRK
ncbi:MAG: hypothetical protein HRT35_19800 [Algicola sp.]|nr:hypothetical protein [Algicola sp.]